MTDFRITKMRVDEAGRVHANLAGVHVHTHTGPPNLGTWLVADASGREVTDLDAKQRLVKQARKLLGMKAVRSR